MSVKANELTNRGPEAIKGQAEAEAAIRAMKAVPDPVYTVDKLAELGGILKAARDLRPPRGEDGRAWGLGRDAALDEIERFLAG